MAYTTLAEVKTHCEVSGNGEDTYLTAVMNAAEVFIENYTGRVFDADAEAEVDYNRYHRMPGESRFHGNMLYFYTECADTPSAITDSPTVIMVPETGPPYYGMYITDGAWAYPTVTVKSYWGYSKTAPADIELAVWMICKWLYDARHSTDTDAVVVSANGQVLIPQGVPKDILAILDPYKKMVLA